MGLNSTTIFVLNAEEMKPIFCYALLDDDHFTQEGFKVLL